MKVTCGIVATALLMVANAPAIAGIETCISIENDLDRLACYDSEARRTPTVSSSTTSAWTVRVEKSKMTDQTNVYLRTEAKDPVQCGSIYGGGTPTLILRCQENRTAVMLVADCQLVSSAYSNYGDITYRIDNLKARTRGFDQSTDSHALGLWSGRRAIPFIKSMLGHKRILMRFTPFSESPVTAEFNITGLEDAIKPLRKACHW